MVDSREQPDIARCDALRNSEQATAADARCETFAVIDAAGIRKYTLADRYEAVRSFVLNSAVPHSIRLHFETAKNLYLYGWFVYRFHPIAEQQALTSLEFALRERLLQAGEAGKGKRKIRGLAARLQRARELDLIRNEGLQIRERLAMRRAQARYEFETLEEMIRTGAPEMVLDDSNIEPNEQDLGHDWIGTFIASLPMIRNAYAHGSEMLHPTVLPTFAIVCDLINQLYPNES